MLQVILTIAGILGLVALSISVLFVLGMRAKSPLVQVPIIWQGKHQFNKIALRTAGTPATGTSIVRHRGRRSGRTFETPVGVLATDDGYLIALPYGLLSNWLRNVLANGGASLVHHGETVEVDAPELIPMATVETAFAPREQRMHRIFNVTDVLHLRRAASAGVAAAA
jgi:deazaflavin-dependent oxidoreductase (nitroreductase family)